MQATQSTSQAGERTQFKVGQLVTVVEARATTDAGREYSAEIIENMLGGFFRLEVDTEQEKHEFWTAHESRISPFDPATPIVRKRLARGRYQVGATIIVRNDPPKHTGHHLVTTWRDEGTNEMLGYTLSEAVSLVSRRT